MTDSNQHHEGPEGGDYSAPKRYSSVASLESAWQSARKSRGTMKAWKSIQSMYDRLPTRTPEGIIEPSFGQLRYRVDQAAITYVDYATERKTWCSIITDEGADGQAPVWSDHITTAFQKYCINKWSKRVSQLMLAVKDMLLFSKGAFEFRTRSTCWPDAVSIETVWPDSQASMFADSFEILFIPRTMTAMELHESIRSGDENGWDKDAVLDLLKSGIKSFKDLTFPTIDNKYRDGSATSDECEQKFDIVVAYVEEYGRESVTKYVFIPTSVGTDSRNPKEKNERRFLYTKYNYSKCISQSVAIVAHTVCWKFYDDPSFAELLYVTAKTYDQVMNRILRAVEDNMRVYLESDGQESYESLKRMQHSEFMVLKQGLKLVQSRIVRPVADASNVVREIIIDQNAGIGQYINNQSGRGGDAKTATQSEIDLGESTKVSGAHLKIFNSYVTILMQEIYRRFTTETKEHSPQIKQFKKFKKYLKDKNVPDSAWDPENCSVESIVSLGAGSPAAKLQAARVIREALSVAARTPGEREAQRLMISSVSGIDNVPLYMPEDEEVAIKEDALIGLENAGLSDASANPRNFTVQPWNLHFRHVASHTEDAEASLQQAAAIFQSLDQLPAQDEGIYLKSVQDTLIGIENKLAHTQAHIQMISSEGNKAKLSEIQVWTGRIQQINGQYDKLHAALAEKQQARMQQGVQGKPEDPDIQKKREMAQLDVEHKATTLALDEARSKQKAEQLRENSAANAEHKRNLATGDAISKARLREIEAASKIRANNTKKP